MELTQIWRSIECHLFAYLRLLRLRLFFLFPRRSYCWTVFFFGWKKIYILISFIFFFKFYYNSCLPRLLLLCQVSPSCVIRHCAHLDTGHDEISLMDRLNGRIQNRISIRSNERDEEETRNWQLTNWPPVSRAFLFPLGGRLEAGGAGRWRHDRAARVINARSGLMSQWGYWIDGCDWLTISMNIGTGGWGLLMQ